MDSVYYIKLDMVDGTSQLVQLSKEEAIALGIELQNQNSLQQSEENAATVELPEDITTPEVILTTENGERIVRDEGSEGPIQIRILEPAEMNLKPANYVRPYLPRMGRPKKERKPPSIDFEPPNSPPPLKSLKQSRTRSGRITRPPKHIQENFKKIVINENIPEESEPQEEIPISDFSPLTTNDIPIKLEPLISLDNHTRKRNIYSQYRCKTCGKAYLGKTKIFKHFKQHPDHRQNQNIDTEYSKTWNKLIDNTKNAREGKRGEEFCRELSTLFTNARILVKYFFKFSGTRDSNSSEYFVDDLLGKLLDVKSGWYCFNENEICKDVSIFSFLENFDSNVLSALSLKSDSVEGNEGESNVRTQRRKLTENVIKSEENHSKLIQNNVNNVESTLKANSGDKQSKKSDCNEVTFPLNLYNEITDVFKTPSFENAGKSFENAGKTFDNTTKPPPTNNFFNKPIFPSEKAQFTLPTSKKSPTAKLSKNFAVYEGNSQHFPTLHKSNGFSGENKSGNFETGGKNFENLLEMEIDESLTKNKFGEENKNKKSPPPPPPVVETTVVDLLNMSDELLLEDSGHVTHHHNMHLIEGGSSNSDDIMNVDQFVNERFKKITEVEEEEEEEGMEIQQNTAEVPPLQIFQFDSSH